MKRNRGPMNKNRIGGVGDRGERANDREVPVTKGTYVNPAVVRGRSAFLPGEISPRA
jgi:hypothetical protein